MKCRKTLLCALLYLCFLPITHVSWAWGKKGHHIVALIAKYHLNEDVKAKILADLEGISLEEASVWADVVRSRPEYEHTRSWHYATVPDGAVYEGSPPEGDVTIVKEQIHALSAAGSLKERAEALKWILHLVADLHQPLHIGNGKDRGGNRRIILFFGEEMRLHYLWDTGFLKTYGKSAKHFAARLHERLTPQLEAQWSGTKIVDWLMESVAYREALYENLPKDSASSVNYYNRHLPMVEQRLLQAGLRLAAILNRLYG